MHNNKVVLGGIIKYNSDGVGFKVVFKDKELANKYKDMMRWILLDDGFTVVSNTGYYDDKELSYR